MRKKVLIFPAGTEIGLEIYKSLKRSKEIQVIGGSSKADHCAFVYSKVILDFPYITDSNFIEYLNEQIVKEKIDFIFPAHDEVGFFLSVHKSEILAEVIITDKDTVKICRSKYETYKKFSEYDFIPKVYEEIDDVRNYPIFVKPDKGQGSKNAWKINDREELENALKKDNTLIISEYLPGDEFTVDCLTDRNGEIRSIKVRSRERVRNGISVRSEIIETDEKVRHIAEILNRELNFCGVWFFQVKRDCNDQYKLLEVSPRIPGTSGVSRNLGINYALLTINLYCGQDIEVIDNDYNICVDRALYGAYKIDYAYDYIYLAYDDTLVINGKINSELLSFLYQAVNEKKKIILLGNHDDIKEKLFENKISANLFNEILCVPSDDIDYGYIKDNSIYIDHSFEKRREVKKKRGIAVFDLDMIESLIDYKV